MLRNVRYLGHWTWNTSKWLRSTTSGKRRCVVRPKGEHVVRELPELGIIDRATWDRVASLLRKQTATGGRTSGVGKHGVVSLRLVERSRYSECVVAGAQYANVSIRFCCVSRLSGRP